MVFSKQSRLWPVTFSALILALGNSPCSSALASAAPTWHGALSSALPSSSQAWPRLSSPLLPVSAWVSEPRDGDAAAAAATREFFEQFVQPALALSGAAEIVVVPRDERGCNAVLKAAVGRQQYVLLMPENTLSAADALEKLLQGLVQDSPTAATAAWGDLWVLPMAGGANWRLKSTLVCGREPRAMPSTGEHSPILLGAEAVDVRGVCRTGNILVGAGQLASTTAPHRNGLYIPGAVSYQYFWPKSAPLSTFEYQSLRPPHYLCRLQTIHMRTFSQRSCHVPGEAPPTSASSFSSPPLHILTVANAPTLSALDQFDYSRQAAAALLQWKASHGLSARVHHGTNSTDESFELGAQWADVKLTRWARLDWLLRGSHLIERRFALQVQFQPAQATHWETPRDILLVAMVSKQHPLTFALHLDMALAPPKPMALCLLAMDDSPLATEALSRQLVQLSVATSRRSRNWPPEYIRFSLLCPDGLCASIASKALGNATFPLDVVPLPHNSSVSSRCQLEQLVATAASGSKPDEVVLLLSRQAAVPDWPSLQAWSKRLYSLGAWCLLVEESSIPSAPSPDADESSSLFVEQSAIMLALAQPVSALECPKCVRLWQSTNGAE